LRRKPAPEGGGKEILPSIKGGQPPSAIVVEKGDFRFLPQEGPRKKGEKGERMPRFCPKVLGELPETWGGEKRKNIVGQGKAA